MALTKLPKNAIADESVDADKIADGTVQAVDITGNLTAGQLSSTLDLSGNTVTLPNSSVTNDMLAGSIANAKLSNSSITINGNAISLGSSANIGVDFDWQSVITADGSTVFTAVSGNGYFVDTTSGNVTVNLPASPSIGDSIAFKDYAETFATNNLTIQGNGNIIQGDSENDAVISTNKASIVLVYVDATKGWLFTNESNVSLVAVSPFISATGGTVTESGDYKIHTFTGDGCFVVSSAGEGTPTAPSVVDYLVVAGGGGAGGYGGGGGAGGFRYSASTYCSPACAPGHPLRNTCGITVTATTYPITVGAGGSGSPAPDPPATKADFEQNTNGSPSSFSTITSTGGGKGGTYSTPCGTDLYGSPGGSGGGGGGGEGCQTANPGAGNTPPVSPPQGNNGGGRPGCGGAPYGGYGAGGGAIGVGAAGSDCAGGAGGAGAGLPNAFGTSGVNCGSYYYFSGGGGGSGSSPGGPTNNGGAGGIGGGGAGSPGVSSFPTPICTAATAGTANTGGGGGGGLQGNASGEAGGKGIVIIRYKFQ